MVFSNPNCATAFDTHGSRILPEKKRVPDTLPRPEKKRVPDTLPRPERRLRLCDPEVAKANSTGKGT